MTSKEAIKTLKENYCAMCAYGSQDMDSCDIRSCDNKDAIQVLEQEPCDKYIKEIDHLRKYISKLETQIVEQKPCEDAISRSEVLDIIDSKDPNYEVRHFKEDVECLPPVSTEKQNKCEDAISRQAVLSLVSDGREGLGNIIYAFDVEQLPSVSVEKTGKWLESTYFHFNICSECKEGFSVRWKHCPNCGAKMEVEE